MGLDRLSSAVRGARGGLVSLARVLKEEGKADAATLVENVVTNIFDKEDAVLNAWTKKAAPASTGERQDLGTAKPDPGLDDTGSGSGPGETEAETAGVSA